MSSLAHKQLDSTSQEDAGSLGSALSLFLTVTVLMMPVTNAAHADSPTPEGLVQVNELLQGKVAFIDLADGTTIKKAKKVTMESNFTYWQANGDEHKVATEQVIRVRARSKSKGLIGLGAGAAAGAFLALASHAGETTCNEIGQCTSDATSEQLGFLVAVGAGAGFGVGKALPNKQKVIYQAPAPPL